MVDRDDLTRNAVRDLAVRLGHGYRLAVDGAEAWDMHLTKQADVIIAAYDLPLVQGVELCRRVREYDAGTRYTYFVMLTGFRDKAHMLSGMLAGADDYELKPLDLDLLEGRMIAAGRVVSLFRKLARRSGQLRLDLGATPGSSLAPHVREEFARLFAIAKRYKRHCCVALVSIGGLEVAGTPMRPAERATALANTKAAMHDVLRDSDALWNLRDDELLVVLTEELLSDAMQVVGRLRGGISRLGLTSTIGLAQLEPFDESAEGWLRRTQRALTAALNAGGNMVEIDA